jgi:L-threonylcarbamoyladenylate synthase
MDFDTQIGTDTDLAIDWLTRGELVAIPTETVYGLAGNALDSDTVLKIFAAKNRPFFDPLIVHTHSLAVIESLVSSIPDRLRLLMETYMPGPLTVLLPRLPIIPDLVTAGMDRVAIRIPAHPSALALLSALPFPLAAPSANPFGYISPTTAQHVYQGLAGHIPYILDGGSCAVGVESTIIAEEHGQIIIYRLGGITAEQIIAIVGEVEIRTSASNPTAPGMLLSHYAPRKPLYLGYVAQLIALHRDQRIGILSFDTPYPKYIHQLLSATGDMQEAAKNLFAAMRALDVADVDVIIAERLPLHGLGLAINDRLGRAAVK